MNLKECLEQCKEDWMAIKEFIQEQVELPPVTLIKGLAGRDRCACCNFVRLKNDGNYVKECSDCPLLGLWNKGYKRISTNFPCETRESSPYFLFVGGKVTRRILMNRCDKIIDFCKERLDESD